MDVVKDRSGGGELEDGKEGEEGSKLEHLARVVRGFKFVG